MPGPIRAQSASSPPNKTPRQPSRTKFTNRPIAPIIVLSTLLFVSKGQTMKTQPSRFVDPTIQILITDHRTTTAPVFGTAEVAELIAAFGTTKSPKYSKMGREREQKAYP
ncbi:hypothetical protein AC578_6397 [Pseudocercospora eumusae]|uniref:Uncharacterized protein n=1 Tax=Pseudocercospora eumusae TaxID=321146 RepID=A0A139GVR8_9PEZI|nr:hypothetical protein AC578_6397 [Pseudocercospora eumusae]